MFNSYAELTIKSNAELAIVVQHFTFCVNNQFNSILTNGYTFRKFSVILEIKFIIYPLTQNPLLHLRQFFELPHYAFPH
jgi:hypothetical protein